MQKAQAELVGEAAYVFSGELIELIDGICRDKEQRIDHENLDEVIRAEWGRDSAENAAKLIAEFTAFIEENRDELEALEIFYDQPFRRRELLYDLVADVLNKLQADKPNLAPLRVWQAYSQIDDYKGQQPLSELTALVALIRRVCGIDETLTAYDATVRRNFQRWILQRHAGAGEKFNEEQVEWLQMIRDHIGSSFHLERDDLEMAPFDGQGGLMRMYQLFGAEMDDLIDELNEALAA